MDKLNFKTENGIDKNVAKIATIFPEVITETKYENGNLKRVIDTKKLSLLLGDSAVDSDYKECYEFTWPGKNEAIMEAANATTNTLRPCKEESKNWDTTQNLYIEGDNLEVLKLLQESYLGKVKMIYIDPPYNTGKDFVYRDNFHKKADEYKEENTERDEEENQLFQNNESNGRFHSEWCSMIYPRLKLARDLLREDGVIFISIDDNEVRNLRNICDEIFGESNFISQLIWKKKQGGGNDSNHIVTEHEYILCYSKFEKKIKLNLDFLYKLDNALYPYSDDKGEYGLITLDKASIQFSKSLVYEIEDENGNKYFPRIVKGKQSCWRWSREKVLAQYNELVFKSGKVYTKYYRPQGVTPRSLLIDSIYGRTETGNDDIKNIFKTNPFSYPKPISLIRHFISISNIEKDYIILDFFSGSATTAHACMQLNAEDGGNRKFIMVQLPEVCTLDSEAAKTGYKNICEIGKERIRRAGEKIKAEHATTAPNLDIGFRVLKLDSSNMKDVFYSPDEISQDLLTSTESNIKEDRTPLDLLYSCLIDWGVDEGLSLPIKTETIDGAEVFTVNDGEIPDLITCFDENISTNAIKQIANKKPLRVVFRDSSFADSPAKINVTEIFKTISPNTTIKVL